MVKTIGKKIIDGSILFIPLSSAPSTPSEGQVYYNDILKKYQFYDGTDWKDLGSSLLTERSVYFEDVDPVEDLDVRNNAIVGNWTNETYEDDNILFTHSMTTGTGSENNDSGLRKYMTGYQFYLEGGALTSGNSAYNIIQSILFKAEVSNSALLYLFTQENYNYSDSRVSTLKIRIKRADNLAQIGSDIIVSLADGAITNLFRGTVIVHIGKSTWNSANTWYCLGVAKSARVGGTAVDWTNISSIGTYSGNILIEVEYATSKPNNANSFMSSCAIRTMLVHNNTSNEVNY